MNNSQSILITGASSGIGLALAQKLAAPGVSLHLGGRDPARLEAAAAQCRALGATALCRLIDVRDRAAMADWITTAGQLDLVIAGAGISAGTDGGAPEGPDQVRAIFATNLDGALNTMLPALAVMAAQDPGPDGLRGRIACIASIAGFIALPHAPSYCAAKAAADRWTVATAPQARALGVRMVSICPGYVRTPMTAINRFPMPGLMNADQAALHILHAIAGTRERVAFPAWFASFVRLAALLPPRWIEIATSKSPGKASG
jgi:NAD(P)-dependent dehydrogenase (short-subunit alcohol dehydrogenase family)